MQRPPVDPGQIERWHDDGWCLLEGLLPADEVAAARDDVARLFPSADEFAASAADRPSNPTFPFDGPALNRLALHDRLLDLAEVLLADDDVRLYQGSVSTKYSGAADDEQMLHADYGNHTLVVPRADHGYQQLLVFVYLTDVTADTAATRLVPRSSTADIPVERTYLSYVDYPEIYRAEVAAVGPAGSVLAYRPDVYHRGVTLTAPQSVRFILHVAFKTLHTDWVGFHTWPVRGEDAAWHRFVRHATPRQLTALGFPVPGDPYWTPETLDGVAARYPTLDMTPWRKAAGAAAGAARR